MTPPVTPNFIVIGQAKCGTTTVCEALRRHPRVFITEPKEPHFYLFRDPVRTREWYESLFEDVRDEVAIGEGSTSYTRPDVYWDVAANIHAEIPDARLVFMARDPIARLESDWKMRVREGRATWNDINKSLDDNPQVVELGRYWRNLSTYRELFPEEQLLILFLEDFSRAPDDVLRRIHRHIGVEEDPEPLEDVSAQNTASSYRRDGTMMNLARRIGLVDAGRRLLPTGLAENLKARFSSPYRYEANWDPRRLADLQVLYREESAPLLEYCGKPSDFWSYESRERTRAGTRP